LTHLARTAGREEFDLLVEISDGYVAATDNAYVDVLDSYLRRRRWQSTSTVANTIFPNGLAMFSGSRQRLYERYESVYERARRASSKNQKGIYFHRLIRYPLQRDPARSNQLETVIRGLQGALLPGGLHHAYELQVFCPGKDKRPRGFPCMSSISLHVERGRLRMAATYRNQYYVQKALGNFIGLARLQGFLAEGAGIPAGALSVHAFHAQIDPGVTGADIEALLRSLEGREPRAA
jgi:thymidylate synthase